MFSGQPAHYCPGCKQLHVIHVSRPNNKGERWTWDGNMDRPTVDPSVNINNRCHYSLIDGTLAFSPDSDHALAGMSVPLPVIPDWLK